MEKQILGVIGGLGPLATAHFMELVTQMTNAETEQDHVEMIVYSYPSTPDRSAYILGNSKSSPITALTRIGQGLVKQKVSCIAVTCVTAHYFHKELQSAISVPIINGVKETATLLKRQGIRKAGIMATDGTIRSGLLAKELDYEGILPVLPSKKRQADVMRLIYKNVKAGVPADMRRFYAVAQELWDCGAEVIILGCTELSVIKRDYCIGPGYLDVMEVLAREAVIRCGRRLKPEYECLIKGGTHSAAEYTGISGGNRKACTGKGCIPLGI